MKQHDLMPPLRVQLLNNKTPIDLTTITAARVIITTLDKSSLLMDRAITVEAGTDGWVSMNWQTGDTATVGRFRVEVEVIWPTDRPQTFPVHENAWLIIEDDLG
jgi:hypothetical protein